MLSAAAVLLAGSPALPVQPAAADPIAQGTVASNGATGTGAGSPSGEERFGGRPGPKAGDEVLSPFVRQVRQADGSVRATVFNEPAFAKGKDGKRKLVDNTVTDGEDPAQDAAQVKGAFRPVKFGRQANRLLDIELTDGSVRFGVRDVKLGKPERQSDGTVLYRDVALDTDLRLTPAGSGVRTELVLRSAQAPTSFTFDLADPRGLLGQARPEPSGAVVFSKPVDDGVALQLEAPYAYEERPDDPGYIKGAESGSAAMTVSETKDGWSFTKTVGKDWLRGKQFPIVLDPTLRYGQGNGSTVDCTILNGAVADVSHCNATSMELGFGSGTNTAASFRRMTMIWGAVSAGSIPANATISDAKLSLTVTRNFHNQSMKVSVHNQPATWNNTATWNSSAVAGTTKTPWSNGTGNQNVPAALDTKTLFGLGEYSWNVTSAARSWFTGGPYRGLHVRMADPEELSTATRVIQIANAHVNTAITAMPKLEVTYSTPPTEPLNITAAPADRSIQVSYSPPGNAATSEPTGYRVYVYDAAGAVVRPASGLAYTDCPAGGCTVGGLANGAGYTVRVSAVNNLGEGPQSAPTAVVVPFGRPGRVLDLTANADPAPSSVRLTWSAATRNGRDITDYTVRTFRQDTRAEVGAVSPKTCAASPCDISPLENNVGYLFTVAANAGGLQAEASNEALATPYDVPTAVPSLSVDRGDRAATLRWGAAGGNGRDVTGYEVVLFDPAGNEVTRVRAAGTARAHTFTTTAAGLRLTNGTDYRFQIRALNPRLPGGPIGTAGPSRPATLPDFPVSVTAKAETGKVTVTFDSAAYGSRTSTGTGGYGQLGPGSGGEPVTGYTITLVRKNQDGSETVIATRTPAYDPAKPELDAAGPQVFTSPDVVDGTPYYATVAARNVIGGSGAKVSETVTPLQQIGLTKQVAPAQPSTADGDARLYTLTLTNPNSSPADVTVTDTPDPGVRIPRARDGKTPDIAFCRTSGVTCLLEQVTRTTGPAAGLLTDKLTISAKGLQPGTTTLRYPAQPDPGAGASTCSLLGNTAAIRDPLSATAREVPPTTTLGCDAGLGLEPWWTFRQLPIGPQASLSVNVSNGNAVVQAVDSTTVQAHGRLSYALRRTYNSAARTAATLPGSIGAGWNFNFGESDDAGLSAGSSLRIPSLGDAADTLTHPLSLTLVDRDGTRHAFRPRSVNLTTPVAQLTGARAGLKPLALPGASCLDVAYDAPSGVHLGLFRYVQAGDGGCANATPASNGGAPGATVTRPDGTVINTVVAGYVAIRPDRLRAEYDALGRLVALTDAAGVELRYLYAAPVDLIKPLDPARLRLTAVFEPRSCSTTGSTAPTGTGTSASTEITRAEQIPQVCRAFRFDYTQATSTTQPAVSVTDPAHRTTRYELSNSLPSGDPTQAAALLLRVIDPDAAGADPTTAEGKERIARATTSYGYGSCGGAADQLCSITDRRGNTTRLTYTGSAASDPAGSPARIASTTDRRGARTTYTYDSATQTTVKALKALPDNADSTSNGGSTSSPAVAAQTAGTDQRTVYSQIDDSARVGVLEQFTGDSTDRLRRTEFTWDTKDLSCTRGRSTGLTGKPDNKLCSVVRRAAPPTTSSTGATTTAADPLDERTEFLYTREGLQLRERRTLNSATTLDTTNGYTAQYVGPKSTTLSVDTLAAGGEFTAAGRVDPPSDTLFAVVDRTQAQTPRGNQAPATRGSNPDGTPTAAFSDYLTEFTVDNNPAAVVSQYRPGTSYCTTHKEGSALNSTADPTHNTGLLCESRAPSSTGNIDDKTVGRATYDSFGQKTSATSPKAVADTAPNALPPATRYRYFGDTATDISGTVTAGGWLRDVQDVTATGTSPSDSTYSPAADRFVAYDYDAAGNTVRTWDRDATAGRSRDSFPGALTGDGTATPPVNRTGSLVAPNAAVAVFANTNPARGAGAEQADYSRPWRYQRAASNPGGDRTETLVDPNGNPTRISPPRGTNELAASGTRTATSSFDVTSTYDNGDVLLASATPLQRAAATSTRHRYDAFGNKVATTWPDAAGETTAETGKGRRTTVWRYDAVNRTVATLTSRGVTTSSPQCRPAGASDAPLVAGRTLCETTTTYDRLDNATGSTDADGAQRTTTYDAVHRPVRQLAPRGKTNGTPDAPSLLTEMTYDPDGRVLDLCRPRQNAPAAEDGGGGEPCSPTSRFATHTRYDTAGRPDRIRTSRTSGLTLTTVMRYDADGNTVLVRNPRGTQTPGTQSNGTPAASTENGGIASLGSTAFDTTSTYDLQGRLVRTVAPRVGATRYLYTPAGDTLGVAAPGSITNSPAPGDPAADNDAATSAADKALRITGYTYDPNHRVIDTVTALQLPAFTAEQLRAKTDPASSDAALTDASAQTNLRTRVAYDPDGNPVTTFGPRAFASPTSDDGAAGGKGSAALLTTPDVRFKRTTVYDPDGRPTSQLSPRSQTSGTYADPIGQDTPAAAGQCRTADGYPTDVLVCRTTVGYDRAGNVTTVQLPTGQAPAGEPDASRTLSYAYTDDNLPAAVTAPNPAGELDPATPNLTGDGRIVVSRTSYDGSGRPTSTTDALDRPTTTRYTADGLVAEVTTPAGSNGPVSTDRKLVHTTSYTYNADGQVIETATPRATSGDTPLELTRYFDDGLVAERTAGTVRGSTTSKATGALTTRYTYDGAGNPATITSPEAAARGSINPLGEPVRNEYTPDNLLLASTQPVTVTAAAVTEARVTRYTYDDAGRKTATTVGLTNPAAGTSAATTTQRFAYYPTDLMASQTGRGGERITHRYDADGQQTRVTDSTSTDSAVTGSYYLDGLPRQVAARGRATSYGYDGSGALTARATSTSGTATGGVTGTGSSTTGAGLTVFDRNDAGLPLRMTEPPTTAGGPTGTSRWTFDKVGRLILETRPNGQSQSYGYDTDDLLTDTTITLAAPEGAPRPVLARWSYRHDELGRILSQTYSGTAASTSSAIDLGASSGSGPKGTEPAPASPVSYTTAYDTAGRISTFTDARGPRTVEFDRNNNRLTYGTTATGGTAEKDPSSWTYRADDSIRTSTLPANPGTADPGAQVPRTYSYQPFGGVRDDGCTAYAYDGFDRLTRTSPTTTGTTANAAAGSTSCLKPDTTYTYDGLDRQTSSNRATVTGGPATSSTKLHYDGWNDTVVQQTTSPLGTSTGTTPVDLTFILDASGAPKTALPTGGTTTATPEYLAHDGTRSTGLITGPDGAARCLARYDAYGNPDGNNTTGALPAGSCASGSSANDVFYRGSRKDTTTGQYTLGSRTYDPTKATFLTPDSYRTSGSAANTGLGVDPLTRNSYSYVNGDPINNSDPSGHIMAPDRSAGCDDHCNKKMSTVFKRQRAEVRRDWKHAAENAQAKHGSTYNLIGALGSKAWDAGPGLLAWGLRASSLPGAKRDADWIDKKGEQLRNWYDADIDSQDYRDGTALGTFLSAFVAGGPARGLSSSTAGSSAKAAATVEQARLLKAAEEARDAAARKPDGTPARRRSPIFIGGYDDAGNVMGTGNGPKGLGIHAEDIVQARWPGARMTAPYGWRRNAETGELEWQKHTVCRACQAKYPKELFPPGTRGEQGGAWRD